GRVPAGFRLTNVLLHLATGVCLWLLLRRIADRPWLPEVAGLLFLFHPASAEPVGWIVARGDLLSALFGLLAIHAHLSGRTRPAVLPLAVLAYFAALSAKLSAAPFPLLAFLCERRAAATKAPATSSPVRLWRYGLYLLPLVAYGFLRFKALGTLFPSGVSRTWHDPPEIAALFVSGALLFRYVLLFLVPAGMCTDYSADPVFSSRLLTTVAENPAVPLLAAGTVALLAAAVLLRRRAPWFAFGVFWFLAALLTVSQVVPIGAVMADRFLYLPAAGGAAALAAGLLSLRRSGGPAIVVVLACFAAVTFVREAAWRDDRSMNEDVVRRETNYPANANAWNRLGLHYRERGDVAKEEECYVTGLSHDGDDRWLLKNWGALLAERGSLREARLVLTRAFTKRQPADRQKAAIAFNLAVVLIAEGEKAGAALVLEEAVLCRPPLPLAFERLGRLYLEDLDRPERGRELLDAARRLAGPR
ncbi:MAG: hypothetical protein MUE73_17510, partial [Planctomycetes bacterium]|nr:hypothetical protein [Planctomycetota bacterium]